MTLRVTPDQSAETLADLAALLLNYAREHGWDTEPAHLEEIATLPGPYALPLGSTYVAYWSDEPVGCVVLRPVPEEWGAHAIEMRRLYVTPPARRSGVARALVEHAERFAREAGYGRIRLVTLADMEAAHQLYRSLGFVDIEPYRTSTAPRVYYMEKLIAPHQGQVPLEP